MSMLTLRQAFARRSAAITALRRSVALCALSTTALLGAAFIPSPITVPRAAEPVPTHPTATTAPRSAAASPTQSPWQMANIADPLVDTWVHRFTTSLRDDIAAALERGGRYVPMITRKLAERGMPQELVYLPLIESQYKSTARSRVAAVGLWQFMAGTARMFGLSVGRHADERTDAAKETDAALSYLSELHDRFGSWYLAAAAYNAGPGTIARAMEHVLGRSTGSDSDVYKISRRLPSETRNYVPKLIAAARIGRDPGHFGLAQ